MAGILNQDEIDMLLGGGKPSAKAVSSGEPVKFDFGSQPKIIRGKIPALDIVNDRFARSYQRILSRQLSSSVSVTPTDVKTMKMSEYLRDLFQPTSLNIVKLNPFEGGSITIVMEAKFIYDALNVHYGGSEDFHYKIEGKDFHPFEKDYIQNLLLTVFDEYQRAWEPIESVTIEPLYSDTNPRYETSTSPNETVYVSKMNVSFDGGGGAIYFCIPLNVLGSYLDDLDEKVKTFQGGVGVNWRPTLMGEALETKVKVDCKLGECDILYSDLASLKVGDVIPLAMFDKSVVLLNGYPVFTGELGISDKGFKAVKISNSFNHPASRGEF